MMKNKLVLIFISILFFNVGYSKEDTLRSKVKGQFSVGINPFFMNKPKFKHYGEEHLKGFHALSGEVFFKYNFAIHKKWSLSTGLGVGFTPVGTKFSTKVNEQGNLSIEHLENISDWVYHFSSLPGFYTSLNVGLEREILSIKNDFLFVGLNMKVYWYLARMAEYSYETEYYVSIDGSVEGPPITPMPFSYIEFKDGRFSTLNASLQLNVGYGLALRNNHNLKFSFTWNLSPFERFEGYYLFKGMASDSKGTYTYGINNFGVGIEWGIGKKNR